MKLKERRLFLIMNEMREILMNSEKDIGVLIQAKDFQDVVEKYSQEELTYTIRYLIGKGYFVSYYYDSLSETNIRLTIKGYNEWLFPVGPENPKKIFFSYSIVDKFLAGKIKF